jgi:hypothetical protein
MALSAAATQHVNGRPDVNADKRAWVRGTFDESGRIGSEDQSQAGFFYPVVHKRRGL